MSNLADKKDTPIDEREQLGAVRPEKLPLL